MKKFLTWVSLGILLVALIAASLSMGQLPPTYDGSKAAVSAAELQQDPESYSVEGADGAAAVIVQENLAKTRAVNDVTSIVFDFRGYDTMGEAFILITAVAGSAVILFTKKTGKGEEKK
jgi:hypothetical protein